jgi:UDP-N-acetylmuramate--alanine ligase
LNKAPELRQTFRRSDAYIKKLEMESERSGELTIDRFKSFSEVIGISAAALGGFSPFGTSHPVQKPLPRPGKRSVTSLKLLTTKTATMFGKIRKIHFIGIGGIGMSGLAEILLAKGFQVSGSDRIDSPIVRRLARLGARTAIGHSERHLQDCEAVVFSTAIPEENPELRAARQGGLPTVHRAEILAELLRRAEGITVTGTHGKTTTTAMLGLILRHAGLDPTIVVGARVPELESNAVAGSGAHVLAEADESDRSFLKLRPIHTLLTNIDLDHLDCYRDLGDLQDAFLEHLQSVPFYGNIVVWADDPNGPPVWKKLHRPMIAFGFGATARFRAADLESTPDGVQYACWDDTELLGTIELKVRGKHNALNSLGAVAMASSLEIPFPTIARALQGFQGAERRMERIGERNGVTVLNDYGHHPAEIEATLEACRSMGRRIVLVFQPHRFSRTLHLMERLAQCFGQTDELYLMDVYAAGEAPIEGVDSARLAEMISAFRPVHYAPDADRLLERLRSETRPGDLLVTMGAGDVGRIGRSFIGGDGDE